MHTKVKEVLSSILESFKSGNIPEVVSYSMFPMSENIPSSSWSFLNRTIQFLSGTSDARGFIQWKDVNRYVKKGEKAYIFILVPWLVKSGKDDTLDETRILKGFITKPVFAYEQTEGEELECIKIEIPDLPLMDVARKWNINVKGIPGNYKYMGYFSQSRKEIALATSEEMIFFHELAHCAHSIIIGELKKGQDPLQEIIAELSAATLSRIVGKSTNDTLGNSYHYIESYAEKVNLCPLVACTRALSEVERVMELILFSSPEHFKNMSC